MLEFWAVAALALQNSLTHFLIANTLQSLDMDVNCVAVELTHSCAEQHSLHFSASVCSLETVGWLLLFSAEHWWDMVCVGWWGWGAWKRMGDVPVVRKKLSSDFKGVSEHAALSQPSVDASSGWPCKFHHKYLWSLLSCSNLTAYTFRFFLTTAYNLFSNKNNHLNSLKWILTSFPRLFPSVVMPLVDCVSPSLPAVKYKPKLIRQSFTPPYM